MILLAGGTGSAVALTKELLPDYEILYTAATDYGISTAKERIVSCGDYSDRIVFLSGRLDSEGFKKLIEKNNINCIIDATHPFAKEVSEILSALSGELNLSYLRYDPTGEELKSEGLFFKSQEEAADFLERKNGKIFLTTGSKELKAWEKIDKKRLVVRVLPTVDSIKKCETIGLTPKEIIAAQGPFSVLENVAIIKRYGIDYIVFKESGKGSGLDEKLEAAREMNITPVIITRPETSDRCFTTTKSIKEELANV